MSFGPPLDSDAPTAGTEIGAELAERDFGVVAGTYRLDDHGFPFGEEAGEQDAGLDLRAGYGQFVLDGAERAAGDFERRKFVFAGLNLRAHLGQGLHDALHGPAAERFIAEDAAAKGLGGEDAGEHADGGSGIAGVESGGGLPQALKAASVHDEFGAGAFDLDAQCPHTTQRGMAICAAGVVGYARLALGDGGQHGVAMGDGLVAGQRDGTRDTRRGRDRFLHGR